MIARESEVHPTSRTEFFGLGNRLRNFRPLRVTWVTGYGQVLGQHPDVRFALVVKLWVRIDHETGFERARLTLFARWPRRPWFAALKWH